MIRKLLQVFIGVGIFLFFVFFSYLVHKDLFTQFDFNTTVRFQDKIPRSVDHIFSLFSVVGSFEASIIILLIILAVVIVLRRKLSAVITFVLTISAFVGLHVIELYGKTFVDHLPPPEFMVRTERLVEFPQFHIRQEFSYPSGHAGRAAFISTILILFLLFSKKISRTQKVIIISIIASYDITMFISRIYLGEHWTTDVIGGILLGVSLGILGAL